MTVNREGAVDVSSARDSCSSHERSFIVDEGALTGCSGATSSLSLKAGSSLRLLQGRERGHAYWLKQTLVVCAELLVMLPGRHEVVWNGVENTAEDLGLERQPPVGNNISWNAQTTYIMYRTRYPDILPKLVADRVLKAIGVKLRLGS